MSHSLGHRLRRAGSSAIEFALVLPVLTLLMVVTADAAIWLRIWLRLDHAAAELANIASQYDTLHSTDITALFAAGQTMAGRTDVTGLAGATIISVVSGTGTANTVVWQQRIGNATIASRIGTAGKPAVLPSSFLVPAGQTVLAAEMYTGAAPWVFGVNLMGGSGPGLIRTYAIVRPRSSSLTQAPS